MKFSFSCTSAAVLGIAVMVAGEAGAHEPAPTPTPVGGTGTLTEYASRHSLRAKGSGPPSHGIEITDENLKSLAGNVELTAVSKGDPADTVSDPAATPNPSGTASGDSIGGPGPDFNLKTLDRQITQLWDDFYSCDDSALREREIRPRLSRLLSERARLSKETKGTGRQGGQAAEDGESRRDSNR